MMSFTKSNLEIEKILLELKTAPVYIAAVSVSVMAGAKEKYLFR